MAEQMAEQSSCASQRRGGCGMGCTGGVGMAMGLGHPPASTDVARAEEGAWWDEAEAAAAEEAAREAAFDASGHEADDGDDEDEDDEEEEDSTEGGHSSEGVGPTRRLNMWDASSCSSSSVPDSQAPSSGTWEQQRRQDGQEEEEGEGLIWLIVSPSGGTEPAPSAKPTTAHTRHGRSSSGGGRSRAAGKEAARARAAEAGAARVAAEAAEAAAARRHAATAETARAAAEESRAMAASAAASERRQALSMADAVREEAARDAIAAATGAARLVGVAATEEDAQTAVVSKEAIARAQLVSASVGSRAQEVARAVSEAMSASASDAAASASLSFCCSASANLSHLRVAVAQHEADSLFGRRKYWYKPVALLGGIPYSITEGEALPFKFGKRMLAANDGATSRQRSKGGFLVYECAARALQAALVRPRGKLATSTKAVLRVTASRPCAPPQSKWPTEGGLWAFEVIVPVSIALEAQTWMEDKSLGSLWLPASPPGLCKQCALGERVCVQVRSHLEMGQPPRSNRTSGGGRGGRGVAAKAADEQEARAWIVQPGEGAELDFRSFV
jgi:hypothetical protein